MEYPGDRSEELGVEDREKSTGTRDPGTRAQTARVAASGSRLQSTISHLPDLRPAALKTAPADVGITLSEIQHRGEGAAPREPRPRRSVLLLPTRSRVLQCLLRSIVAHKTRQFEDWMADTLENFRMHQEILISRMPRIVRNVTMREFTKYKGDVQAAVKGLSRELLGSEDATIDFGTRKRKWVESQEAEDSKLAKGQDTESSRNVKSGMPLRRALVSHD